MSLFCEEHHCPPSEFEERAFRACLYWRARILAPLIRIIQPGYFDPDFALIRYLAETPGRRDAMNELAAFVEANNARGGFARKILRIRISARKTSQLIGRLFERRGEERARSLGLIRSGVLVERSARVQFSALSTEVVTKASLRHATSLPRLAMCALNCRAGQDGPRPGRALVG